MTTKIHATRDALGNPTGFHLTPGQAHDLEGADALLPRLYGIEAPLADKARDAEKRVLERLRNAGIEIVMPPKDNGREKRKYDKNKYGWRHLIENLFQKLRQYRAIATRYDKRATIFLGGVHLVGCVISLT